MKRGTVTAKSNVVVGAYLFAEEVMRIRSSGVSRLKTKNW